MWWRTLLMILAVTMAGFITACNGDGDRDELAVEDRDQAALEPYDGDVAAVDGNADVVAESDSSGSAAPVTVSQFDRRVIRSADLDLVVSDVRAATRNAREIVADHGGYEASSNASVLSDSRERASITFEVPSDTFDIVLNDLRDGSQVIRVEHESTSSQDVTEEFVDLQSRLTNLKATEARFIELLEGASTISEVMNVESEISRIRGEIERIQGRINYLEQRTDYSSIHVSFEEIEDEEEIVAGTGFTPGGTAREAWNQSMEFVGAVANALIMVVVFFWWVWPLLGLGLLVAYQYRRRRLTESSA
jgi:hypothetical protein